MSNRFLIGLGIAIAAAAAVFFTDYTIDMTTGQVIAGLVVAEAGALGTYLRATRPEDVWTDERVVPNVRVPGVTYPAGRTYPRLSQDDIDAAVAGAAQRNVDAAKLANKPRLADTGAAPAKPKPAAKRKPRNG